MKHTPIEAICSLNNHNHRPAKDMRILTNQPTAITHYWSIDDDFIWEASNRGYRIQRHVITLLNWPL